MKFSPVEFGTWMCFKQNAVNIGAWLSLVERSVWDREVASSNLAAPTNQLFSD